ncbi:MAG: DNA repair protein RecN [Bacteroidales bacterium]|nr:DNA repair protein RecN [Bacteroidales bacterium]
MLTTLHIENYALIHETDITFDGGFVVITGETGAGKSILLGALGLLLGQRADTQVLSDKERKCVVEASFDISGLGLQPLFEQYDADYDDVLILRREILPTAKSRAFVNDSPANLQFLKELGPHILDIHSQYQTLTLTESLFQTQLLDSFSDSSLLAQYQSLYRQYGVLKHQLEQLTAQDAENNKVLDYNRFLFEELQAAKLQPDEQQELEEEAHLLEHTGAIKEALGTVVAVCDGNGDSDDSAVARMVTSRSLLAHVASYHPDIQALHQRLDSTLIELQDILSEVSSLDDRLQFSPERQEQVNDRLDLIYRLQKKHGVDTVAALLDIQQQLDQQLQEAEGLDDRIREVMEQVDSVFALMQQAADKVTAARTKAGRMLEKQLLPVLSQVGMASAKIVVEITPANDFNLLGHDNVRLLFNANQGGTLRPLAEVASGGELSRLMLAVKSVVTQRNLLPTIIFDEIDSGVSGDISVAVGDIMSRMAQHMQVVAISHLPQIAAKASQHLKVAKALEGSRTVSRIRQLNPDERVTEIAVMLSSNPPTTAALQTARELMGVPSDKHA